MIHDIRSQIRDRIAGAKLPPEVEQGVVEELAQHVEDRYRDLTAAGLSHAEALERSLREVQGHERLARELRALAARRAAPMPPIGVESRGPSLSGLFGLPALSGAGRDLRHALRTLRRSPGFTLAAVLTVALCTGPTLATLSAANWLFLRPLPGVADAGRLATVNFGTPSEDGRSYGVSFVSYRHLEELVRSSPAVEDIAGFQTGSVSLAAATGESRVVPVNFVSAHFFDLLGIVMHAGRSFHPDEDRPPGGVPVAVLSHRISHALFGDEDAVGAVVRVNGYTFSVVGVAPRGFPGPELRRPADVWMPGMTNNMVNHRPRDRWDYAEDRGPFYRSVARLAPGATFDRAQADLLAAAKALAARDPSAEKFQTVQPMLSPGVGLEPLSRPRLLANVRALAGVGVVLVLLGVANLANLFVFRAARRTHESGVRRALGASGARLARLHLAETLSVAVAGGALGLLLMLGTERAIAQLAAAGPDGLELPIDWRLLAMAAGMVLGVGLLLGLAPMRLATRGDLSSVLNRGTRSGAPMGTRLRTGLAVTQLVLSLTLLIGALLFVSSLRNLRAVDAGFDPAGVTTYRFGTRLQGYDETRLRAFYRDLTERLEQVPQIEAVAVADGTPMLFGGITWPVEMPGQGRESRFPVEAQYVTPEYFHALGIQLRAGRTFTADEVFRADETAVVASESLVRRLFGSPDVVGRALTFSATYSDPARDVRIVGVAEDVRLNDLAARPPEIVYRPMLEAHGTNDVLIVRSSGRAADAIAAVRAATASLDPALPVTMAEELNAAVSARLAEERLAAWVLGALAVLGFVLAAIGIHGLVSQGVVERTREFGIRLSIGATRGQIVQLVLRSAVRLAAIGVPLGLLAAAASSRLVGSRLFGVEPLDAGLYATAVLALLIVVLLAGLAPALRASRANPVDVLRAE